MKSTFCFLFSLIAITVCTQSSEIDDQEYIINNLRPLTIVKGENVASNTLDAKMADLNVPGISVAVVKDQEVLWARGFGFANTNTNQKVTTETLFQAGSISKPLAALAALQLVEEGKIDLDADVNMYLKDWKLPSKGFDKEEKVSIRRLLTHTAGTTVHGFPGYADKDEFPSIIQVLKGEGNTAAIELDKTPGESWRYSGGGYTVMEKVVEDVSGLPLEEYMAKKIFPKIGMENSTYAQPLPAEMRANASLAYNRKGKIIDGAFHNYPEQAAAGLWTTPSDLAKYIIHIQEIIAGNEEGVISPMMAKEMLTKHLGNWGLGPSLRGEGEELLFGHGGKNAGFTNNMIAKVYQGSGIIIMTSGDNGNEIINSLQNAISERYEMGISSTKEIELYDISKEEMNRLVGTYTMEGSKLKARVSVKKGKIVITTGSAHVLEATGPLSFVDLKDPETLIFQEDENEKITGLLVKGPGIILKREE